MHRFLNEYERAFFRRFKNTEYASEIAKILNRVILNSLSAKNIDREQLIGIQKVVKLLDESEEATNE